MLSRRGRNAKASRGEKEKRSRAALLLLLPPAPWKNRDRMSRVSLETKVCVFFARESLCVLPDDFFFHLADYRELKF